MLALTTKAKYAQALRKLLNSDLNYQAIYDIMIGVGGSKVPWKAKFFPPYIENKVKDQLTFFMKISKWLLYSPAVSFKDFLAEVKRYGLDKKIDGKTKPLLCISQKVHEKCQYFVSEIKKITEKKGETKYKLKQNVKELDGKTKKVYSNFGQFLQAMQKDIANFIVDKSELTKSRGFKIVYENDVFKKSEKNKKTGKVKEIKTTWKTTRDAILCMCLRNRFMKLREERKISLAKAKKAGKTKEDSAIWMSDVDYYISDPIAREYLKVFVRAEWSPENLYAAISLVKWRKKARVTKSQINAFLEKFGLTSKTQVNTSDKNLKLLAKALGGPKTNVWDEAKEAVLAIHADCIVNIIDTFSRARSFVDMQRLIIQRKKFMKPNLDKEVKSLRNLIRKKFA